MNRKLFARVLACSCLALCGLAGAVELARADATCMPQRNGFEVNDWCRCRVIDHLWGRMVNYGSGPTRRVYGYPATGCSTDHYCKCRPTSDGYRRGGVLGTRQCKECNAR